MPDQDVSTSAQTLPTETNTVTVTQDEAIKLRLTPVQGENSAPASTDVSVSSHLDLLDELESDVSTATGDVDHAASDAIAKIKAAVSDFIAKMRALVTA
jgi:hypothetical protein